MTCYRPIIVAAVICIGLPRASADALVVTRAMKASTIAEIFIDRDATHVEIEIGAEDLPGFKNLLPDEAYEQLTGQPTPLAERLSEFVHEDWQLLADDEKLSGVVTKIEPGTRVLRDEITGDPLANQPDDAETVLRVMIRYPMSGQPRRITLRPPRNEQEMLAANIGFVVYHLGVAVNDFRYLSGEESVQLDWSDPWYSAFERTTLKRTYHAAAAAFLYVDDFEVRKEIIFRPRDLQQWVDLGIGGQSKIAPEQRAEICQKAATFLGQHTPLKIDGWLTQGTLDRVHFITRSLRTTGVVPQGEAIDMNQAMIGAIFVYPIEAVPDTVSMQWELFNDRISRVPAVATDQAGGMPSTMSADDPVLVWKNFLKNPSRPTFVQIQAPPRRSTVAVPVVALVCVVSAIAIWRRTDSVTWPTIVFGLAAIVAALVPSLRVDVPTGRRPQLADSDASAVTYGLLHNVYRAFDYRDEGIVYDVLARSASGDLLTKIYLEMRESLTLASQGGAKVKVTDVELSHCDTAMTEDAAMIADCRWIVTGSVGHWGHLHQRRNQYHGEFEIRNVGGQWRLTEIEVLSEERL